MKNILFIKLTILTFKVFGQCSEEYFSGFYHNAMFITTNGDTLNRRDSNGFYEGMHLYTDNINNDFSDTITYTIGYYQHGQPIGNWKVHCDDGSFSIGKFNRGIEVSTNDKGESATREQGCYAKIGIWKYYDKDSNLIKTIKYDRSFKRNIRIEEKYILSSTGEFKLIYYDFNSKKNHSISI